ncbi:ROK family protein [Streptococcus dentiloxodontae]
MAAYLTIDIGGTFIKYGLVTSFYKLDCTDKVRTPDNLEGFKNTLSTIAKKYQNSIQGIAISCPGEINKRTGLVFRGGLIPYLKNLPLSKWLNQETNLPVSVINDADAAGLAEARAGALQNLRCGAILVLGTGVGCAIVSGAHLMTLQGGRPSEKTEPLENLTLKESTERLKGQFSLAMRGLQNLLTNTGSAVGFVRQASQILEIEEDGSQVFQALKKGDNIQLQRLFEDYCRNIAYLIMNLQTFLPLEKLAIGGGISAQNSLIEQIKKSYWELTAETDVAKNRLQLPIVASHFRNDANLLGAVCHFLDLY